MKEITIGRFTDNTIVLKDSQVSRHHCRCYEENGKYYIEDLNSSNGVFLNGIRITQVSEFDSKSEIKLGKSYIYGIDIIPAMDAPKDLHLDMTADFSKTIDSKQAQTSFLQNTADGVGKFVIFYYTISLLVITLKRTSKVLYVKPEESMIRYGWPYLLISILFGWWGIPWGPVYTIQSIYTAFVGKDVTDEVLKIYAQKQNA